MKKLIVLCLLLGAIIPAWSQKKNDPPKINIPSFNYNEQKEVIYTEVVQAAGVTPQELYTRALAWFNTYYKNPAEVIKEKKENESINGKGKFRIQDVNAETGDKTPGGIISYYINVSVKDGKYKYEITKVSLVSASYFGIEKWIEENTSGYRFQTASYLVQTDEEIKNLIKDLKKGMSKSSATPKSDW